MEHVINNQSINNNDQFYPIQPNWTKPQFFREHMNPNFKNFQEHEKFEIKA